MALWNGKDPILKERLFGLTGPQGNHGEDVKECYYYLDSTPTHSYMKALYKYPQAVFPYDQLVKEDGRRGKTDPEFELADTGVFGENRYFDIYAEYAKASPNDILIRITAINRGPESATLHLLPTIWFRNTWSWGCSHEGCGVKPRMNRDNHNRISADHTTLQRFYLEVDSASVGHRPTMLFTENETNVERLHGATSGSPLVKDGIHRSVIDGHAGRVNPDEVGTKGAIHHVAELSPGESISLDLRLYSEDEAPAESFGSSFQHVFEERVREADEFYASRMADELTDQQRDVARQAYAGLLWSKQFYHYSVRDWLSGDADQASPPENRRHGRNHDWPHLFNRDVISVPDKWEYPWYAAWDLAFHMIPFAAIDPDFAKSQLLLFLREWYMHPNGQIPAYEFALSDVNPPVHAWACWRVYKMTGPRGSRDRPFLERAFHKLLLNFTWWVNRKDVRGKHTVSPDHNGDDHTHRLLAIPSRERLLRILKYVFDENEFLSPYGIRSLSKVYEENPYVFQCCGEEFRVEYSPAESTTGLFGGNSNWRGPIWLPMNFLLIESLERYHHFYGNDLKVEFPTGSGHLLDLKEVAGRISQRLGSLFLPDSQGRRPCHGDDRRYAQDPHWRDLVLFYEYFHGDTGRGAGASHQTGWTALVTRLLEKYGKTIYLICL